MHYPYMASDLDGTISLHKTFDILDATKQDILRYQQKSGHHFTIATGRNYELTKKYVRSLDVKLPIVTLNGAALIDPIDNKIINYKALPQDEITNLLDYCIENKIDFSLHTPLTILGLKGNERFLAY